MLIFSAVLTLIFTGIIGYLSKFKVNNSKDFTSAGKGMGTIGVTSMLMGAIIGGASTVGTAQMAYRRGVGAIWFILGICTASILLGLLYSKHVGKKDQETIPQIIGSTYGKRARVSSSILLSIGMFIHINGQIIACSTLFTSTFHINTNMTAFIVVCLLVIYVVFGGFWGSTMVGAVKTILLYGTSIICGIILIFKLNAVNDINLMLPKEPWFNIFSGGIISDLASCFATIVGVLSTQTYFQAVMAGRDYKTSRRSCFLTAFLVLPVGIVCTMIGMYMRVNYPNIIPGEAFPLFIMKHLNPILGGVTIATVLISSIATGAGLTLGIATMFARDVYKQFIDKEADDKKQLIFMRVIIVLIGIMAFIVVIKNQNSMILSYGFLSMVFRAAPIFIPIIAALFFKDKINAKMGIYAVLAGPAASVIWILLGLEKISSLYIGLFMSFSIFFISGRSKNHKHTISK